MASPTTHSLLSPSNAHRWLACTAAPRFEQQFPEGEPSVYAAEGTLAHAVCELYVQRRFNGLDEAEFYRQLADLQADKLYSAEMLTTAAEYVEYLLERANRFPVYPSVHAETVVRLNDWIPEGLGTCDNTMIGGDTLHITDYKHGKGVPVDAKANPQMRLYALGALKLYKPIYGKTIKRVTMAIVQPRLGSISEDEITVDDLLAWGEMVKQKARIAYDGEGEFCPGEHCKFCKGKVACRARARAHLGLEDYKSRITPTMAEKIGEPTNATQREKMGLDPLLTNAEIGDILTRGATLVNWYSEIKDYALQAILNGEEIPGWKAVEGRSNRAFADLEKALETLKQAGCTPEQLYKTEPRSFTDIEKNVGKKRFADLLGAQIIKPRGKPTLADMSVDKPAYNSAAADFAGVMKS